MVRKISIKDNYKITGCILQTMNVSGSWKQKDQYQTASPRTYTSVPNAFNYSLSQILTNCNTRELKIERVTGIRRFATNCTIKWFLLSSYMHPNDLAITRKDSQD